MIIAKTSTDRKKVAVKIACFLIVQYIAFVRGTRRWDGVLWPYRALSVKQRVDCRLPLSSAVASHVKFSSCFRNAL